MHDCSMGQLHDAYIVLCRKVISSVPCTFCHLLADTTHIALRTEMLNAACTCRLHSVLSQAARFQLHAAH